MIKKNYFLFLFIITLLLVLFLLSRLVFSEEGHGAGNGGGVVICDGNPADSFLAAQTSMKSYQSYEPASVELGDFYEGRTQFGLQFHRIAEFDEYHPFLANDALYFKDELIPKLKRIAGRSWARWLEKRVYEFKRGIQRDDLTIKTDAGWKELQHTQDVDQEFVQSLHLPSHCHFLQMANYHDDLKKVTITLGPVIFRQGKSWGIRLANDDSVLDPLLVHEAFYQLARERAKDLNSKRARRITALLYADSFFDDTHYTEAIQIEKGDRVQSLKNEKLLKTLLHELWRGQPYQDPSASVTALPKSNETH